MRNIFILAIFWTVLGYVNLASAEAGPFKKIEAIGNSIHATFRSQGPRYQVKIDDSDLGISDYGQTIVIPSGRTLTLIDKHSHCSVWPRFAPPPPALVGRCNVVGPVLTDDIRINWPAELADNKPTEAESGS